MLLTGLYHKLHGVPRPVAMKKTVIKRRKRVPAVGSTSTGGRGTNAELPSPASAPASVPTVTAPPPHVAPPLDDKAHRASPPFGHRAPQPHSEHRINRPLGPEAYGLAGRYGKPSTPAGMNLPGSTSTSSLNIPERKKPWWQEGREGRDREKEEKDREAREREGVSHISFIDSSCFFPCFSYDRLPSICEEVSSPSHLIRCAIGHVMVTICDYDDPPIQVTIYFPLFSFSCWLAMSPIASSFYLVLFSFHVLQSFVLKSVESHG